jgi:hypothetical protein
MRNDFGRLRTSSSPVWNHVVLEALDLLPGPLSRLVERRMKREYGNQWLEYALGGLQPSRGPRRAEPEDLRTDLSALLQVMSSFWHVAFQRASPRFARTYLEEIRGFRNVVAHGEAVSLPDAFRAADTVHRLLVILDDRNSLRSEQLCRGLLTCLFQRPWPARSASYTGPVREGNRISERRGCFDAGGNEL